MLKLSCSPVDPKANIELFMRRFAGETFDPKRRDRKHLGAVEK